MKISTKIILIVCMLAMICGFVAFRAFYITPSRFTVRYETLSSTNIQPQLDDINILFFSDLDYGEFMDQDRAEKLVNKINDLSADVVIFGGDLFAENVYITEEDIAKVTELLSSINAPLGKFAVLGDFDEKDETRLNTVNSILSNSNFELLQNKAITLHNTGSDSIALVGLDNSLKGTINVDGTFATVSRETYVLAVVHDPDDATLLPNNLVDYCLSGHSLGGQVYYGIGAFYVPDGATNYYRGKNTLSNGVKLDITNGVGTLEYDVRLFSNPEIVLYRLESESTTTSSPTIETTAEETNVVTEEPTTEQPVEDPIEEQPVEEQVTEELPTEEQVTEEQPTEEQIIDEVPVEETSGEEG